MPKITTSQSENKISISISLGGGGYPLSNQIESLLSRFGPRWMNEWYAHKMNYFWLPCDVCGEMFGGHEWDGRSFQDPENPHMGTGVCKIHPIGSWTVKGIIQ